MADKKKKTDSEDELIEEILPQGGLIDELVEETGTVDASPDPVEADSKMVDSLLSTYLGDEMLEKLKEHADIVDFETIDDADNALVFGGLYQKRYQVRSI